MALDVKLVEVIACPRCKGPLQLQRAAASDAAPTAHELICRFDRLAYPLEAGIPVLLENRARTLTSDELPA
ncbi:MAG: Trm112 family protein [Aeromonas sp.]